LLLTFSFLIFFLLLFSSLTLPSSAVFLSKSYCRKFEYKTPFDDTEDYRSYAF
jgi:hypothetical protein